MNLAGSVRDSTIGLLSGDGVHSNGPGDRNRIVKLLSCRPHGGIDVTQTEESGRYNRNGADRREIHRGRGPGPFVLIIFACIIANAASVKIATDFRKLLSRAIFCEGSLSLPIGIAFARTSRRRQQPGAPADLDGRQSIRLGQFYGRQLLGGERS